MGILITDSTLRDAHQSLIATRMRTRDMLPIAEMLDKVGFFSLDVWGGATFDACLRFLNEDPWVRLRDLREKIKNTRLQMVLRGQNLVGYRHYSDDVVREFIRLAVKNGVDVFSIYDALNDVRNMKLAIKMAKDQGAYVQGAICYTTSPVHNVEKFAGMAETLESLGCDSICIKDLAGLISPQAASELVKAIKQRVSIPLALHSHCSSGMAHMSYHAAALAGVDVLDTAFSAFGGGTSLPPTEGMVAAFRDTPYDTGLDLDLLCEIGEYFVSLSRKYGPLFTSEVIHPSVDVLAHQIPGGMFSNLVNQLREQNILDKLDDVLEEVPRVRADLGYPPLAAPASQVVVTQAVLNVLSGKRYRRVTEELKNYLLGHYGRPPSDVNEEVKKFVVGDEKPVEVRPAELIASELELTRYAGHKLGILHNREEDLITYALFPQLAVKFLRGELEEEAMPGVVEAVDSSTSTMESPIELSVDVDGEVFSVKVSPPLGKMVEVEEPKITKKVSKGAIVSPLRGMVLRIDVKVGDRVKKGGVVAVIEALKMENKVSASHAGVVREIFVHEGQKVGAGDILGVVD
jgi:pyruvate carboxylase subunit B